jgi:hypothetical protein
MLATDDLLQQVFTVGAELTSLVLYQSGEQSALELAGRLSVATLQHRFSLVSL